MLGLAWGGGPWDLGVVRDGWGSGHWRFRKYRMWWVPPPAQCWVAGRCGQGSQNFPQDRPVCGIKATYYTVWLGVGKDARTGSRVVPPSRGRLGTLEVSWGAWSVHRGPPSFKSLSSDLVSPFP